MPDTFFMSHVCADHHTRDTDVGETAGLTHELNISLSRNICPSVIEITLVGIYHEISPACVSMRGSAVRDPDL